MLGSALENRLCEEGFLLSIGRLDFILARVFLSTDVLKTVSNSSVYLENSWDLVRNRATLYMFQLAVQRFWT